MAGSNGDCRSWRGGGATERSSPYRGSTVRACTRKRAGVINSRGIARLVTRSAFRIFLILPALFVRVLKIYAIVIRRCFARTMGVMGVFKWLRKDIVQRDRDQRSLTPKINGLNNEAYRNALQAFIDRRRSNPNESPGCIIGPNSPDKERLDFFIKTKNENANGKQRNEKGEQAGLPGVPHVRASDIFEIGWIAGTEDRYMELMFAEWQSTRVALRRHTHPDCRNAVKADLEVLTEIRHPNILLLMGTTRTDDHGLVAIFEPVDCTLYNFVHEQGERVSVQGVAKCAGNLAGALKHAHMRGYVHGAISSHCVFLATCGTVKLGGWELAASVNGSKTPRDYEQRLRYEAYKWQAPEIFKGQEPSKATDVYGLALLMWEMCTMNIPWNGLSKPEVEAQYAQWERGVVTDIYNFPPLLNNLLDAGLQLDVAKRTLDMSRMRRFLQTLEIQYEDAEPIYVERSTNNNNNATKSSSSNATTPERHQTSDSSSILRRASSLTPRTRTGVPSCESRKVGPRPLNLNLIEEPAQRVEEPRDFSSFSRNETTPVAILEHVLEATRVQRTSAKNTNEASPSEKPSSASKQRRESIGESQISRPEIVASGLEARRRDSTRDPANDEDSCRNDTRVDVEKLRRTLADRRKDFFYGKERTRRANEDEKPESAVSRAITEARSKDYEPHKPASHKTSLEPKQQRSPGQFDSSTSPRSAAHKSQKSPYACVPSAVRNAVVQPKILNSDSRSFFETSLWRKEKMICIAKMRKDRPTEDPTDRLAERSSAKIGKDESVRSDETYTVERDGRPDATRNLATTENDSRETNDSAGPATRSVSLRALKESLDRATDIVLSNSAYEESTTVATTGSPDEFDPNTSTSAHESIFEELYELGRDNADGEIRSIERTNDGINVFFPIGGEIADDEELSNVGRRSGLRDESKRGSLEPARLSGVVCESIAESLHENDRSSTDSKFDDRTVVLDERRGDERSSPVFELNNGRVEEDEHETSFALMIFGDKSRECRSCNPKSNLPRRRSLPAALGQLRNLSNVSLGKLPIRKGDVPDNTVEDIYIDDEFGDSLNVNMVLLDGDAATDDEDFLPDLDLSDAQDYS